MHIMTRVGGKVIDLLNKGADFISMLHSIARHWKKDKKGRCLALCADGKEIYQPFPG